MGGFTLSGRHGTNAAASPRPWSAGPLPPEYSPMTDSIAYHQGMSPLAELYDGFVLDLWGVIHDGVTLYPDVVETLTRLADLDKTFVMLSNAPRRASAIAESMAGMGMPERFCANIMSSGEATWQALADGDPDLGDRCVHIGPERDENLFDGIDVERVPSVEDAAFIVNTGPWADGETVEDYEAVLQDGARASLPMICANPDLVVIRGGRKIICAGALAARYEELGGQVIYFGKPYPAIYERCFDMLGAVDPSRLLAVGDSLRTDIAGAVAAGIDSALVLGGIHGDEIGMGADGAPNMERLNDVCRGAGSMPTFALPAFVWTKSN